MDICYVYSSLVYHESVATALAVTCLRYHFNLTKYYFQIKVKRSIIYWIESTLETSVTQGLGFDLSGLFTHGVWLVRQFLVSLFPAIWIHFLLDWVGIGPYNLGSFPLRACEFNNVLTSGKGYVPTLCPSSPSYPSLRVR